MLDGDIPAFLDPEAVAVQGEFNPYREWLGLAADAPNHYALLSLADFEADTARIVAAAERATTKVRSFRPGANALAWSQLLDQIVAAKACLCDGGQKAAYDEALRTGVVRSSWAEPRKTQVPSALASLQGELYPPGMGPVTSPGDAPAANVSGTPEPVIHAARLTPASWTDLDPPGSGPHRAAASPRSATTTEQHALPVDIDPMAPVFMPVGDPLAATLPVAVGVPLDAAVLPDAVGSPFAQQPANSWQPAASSPAVAARATYRRRSPVGLLVVAIGSGMLLAGAVFGFVVLSNRQAAPTTTSAQSSDAMVGLRAESTNPSIVPPAPASAPRIEPKPLAKQADLPSAAIPVAPTPVVAPESAPAPLPARPQPSPKPLLMPEQTVKATRAEVEALIKSLEAAKAALGEQNFAVADQQIAKAASLAKLPKHAEAVQRLKGASEYSKQFRQAVTAAVLGLQPGESFQVGSSTQVGFVSGSAEEVTLRIAGSNRRFALNELPTQLALELSEFKLDANSPHGRVVQGAYLLFHQQPDAELKQKERERARSLWTEAQGAGADIKHLLPTLTDNYAELVKDAADGP